MIFTAFTAYGEGCLFYSVFFRQLNRTDNVHSFGHCRAVGFPVSNDNEFSVTELML